MSAIPADPYKVDAVPTATVAAPVGVQPAGVVQGQPQPGYNPYAQAPVPAQPAGVQPVGGTTTTVVAVGPGTRTPYCGPITWIIILILCLFVGPFALFGLCCPCDYY